MATRQDVLRLKVEVDGSKANRSLKKFTGNVKRTETAARKAGAGVERSVSAQTRAYRKLGSQLRVLGGIAVAVGVGLIGRKLVSGLVAATRASAVQELAEIKLAQSIRTTGGAVESVLPELKRYASRLQDITGVGDELILANQSILVSLGGLSGPVLQRAAKAALNLAAAQENLSERAAFDLLAKAATGYTSTLSRYGIILDETIPKAQKFDAALALIEGKFSGQAEAQLNTFAGSVRELGGRFGDLQEAIGEPFKTLTRELNRRALSPFIKDMTDAVTESKAFGSTILQTGADLARFADGVITVVDEARGFDIIGGAAKKTFDELRLGLLVANALIGDFGDEIDKPASKLSKLATELEALAAGQGRLLSEDPQNDFEQFAVAADKVRQEEQESIEERIARYTAMTNKLIALSDERRQAWISELQLQERLAINEPVPERLDLGIEPETIEPDILEPDWEEMTDSWREHTRGFWNEFGDDATMIGQRSVEDLGLAFVGAAFDGAKAWKSFFKDFFKNIARAIAEALILKGIQTAFGGFNKGGIAGGTGSSFFQGFPGVQMAADGMIATGGVSGTDSVPALLTPGEAVLPKGLTDLLRQSASGKSSGYAIQTANSPSAPGESIGPSGARGGGTVIHNNLTVQTLDTTGVEETARRFFENNPAAFAAGQRQAIRVGEL